MSANDHDDLHPFTLEETSIDAVHASMRDGSLSAAALVDAYLARIRAYDRQGPGLNAVVNVNAAAGSRAVALDDALRRTGELSGPLHGIPVLVKDCIEMTGMPTTFGNAAFTDYRSAADATVVAKLLEAGAIVLAKTALPDFATSWFGYSSVTGETRNPYALERDPGASSAGSGAATAANLGVVSLGTDCGGSIRVPASFCNLVGVRSTPGLVSRAGVGCLVFFQDTIGPMCRTVKDAVRVFDVIVGYDPTDSLTAAWDVGGRPAGYLDCLDADGLRGARLGLVTNALGSDAEPSAAPVNEVVRAAVRTLTGAGAEVVEVEIPDLREHVNATSLYVNRTKFDINTFLAARPNAPIRSLQQLLDSRRYHPKLDLLEACGFGPERPEFDPLYYQRLAAREAFSRVTHNVLSGNRLDALVYPSVQVVPPTRAETDSGHWTTLTFPTNTLIASQTWMPAISVPAGFTPDGLPVGLEIVARRYGEATMFRLAYGFEQTTDHRRAPASTPALGALPAK